MMTYLVGAALLLGIAAVSRKYLGPACPRCRGREWDRKLCAPLLFCKRCATRIDSEGRAYN